MKKTTITTAVLMAASITFSSCGGTETETTDNAKENSSGNASETTTEVEAIVKNTFVNPDLSMMSEALTKSEFEIAELKNAVNFETNLGQVTIIGNAYNKTDPSADSVIFSSQTGYIVSEDGGTIISLAKDYTDEKTGVLNGQKVAVTGTLMLTYSDVYDTKDEKCSIFMKSSTVEDPTNLEVVHVNDVMNLKSGQAMDASEVKNVISDYIEAIINKGPIKVSCKIKSVFHSGMKNDDGTFMDAQITVVDLEKDYFSLIFAMKEVPSEEVLNELISSQEVVTFEGTFDGSSLKDAVLQK